jgi:serine/threonine-protein kinase HipA
MSSDKPREAFVYLQLPQSLEVVTAGKLTWRSLPEGRALGDFVYGKRYLERARREHLPPLDPFALPLEERRFTFDKLGGLPGVIRDASPDYWGRMIIQRQLQGRVLTEIDYLLSSPEDRAGALSFGLSATPPAPVRQFNRTVQLAELLEEADRLQNDPDYVPRDRHLAEQVENAIHPGTSMGGARPKVVVEDGDGLWLAKLPAKGDERNYPRIEHGALLLAAAAGLVAPESRIVTVIGKDVLLVKRFDRRRALGGYRRALMASGLTLIDADESREASTLMDGTSRWSYPVLASRLALWSSDPAGDLRELFARMALNAMITNDDDHPRNHAVLNWGSGWRLSPVYDLVPNPRVALDSRPLALDVGEQGRQASRNNVLSRCELFRLSQDEAHRLVDKLEKVVRRWPRFFEKAGLSAAEMEKVSGAFLYPGYSQA